MCLRIRHCARKYVQSGNRIQSDVGPLGDLCETNEQTQGSGITVSFRSMEEKESIKKLTVCP